MVGPVTAKVLTQTLRDMERDGFVTRRSLRVNPPHVEYELTRLGASLMDVVEAARHWASSHLDDLIASRRTHESTEDLCT